MRFGKTKSVSYQKTTIPTPSGEEGSKPKKTGIKWLDEEDSGIAQKFGAGVLDLFATSKKVEAEKAELVKERPKIYSDF